MAVDANIEASRRVIEEAFNEGKLERSMRSARMTSSDTTPSPGTRTWRQ